MPLLKFGLALLLGIVGFACESSNNVDQPNIVWITAEDMSPVLGYLGDTYAITPNLDKLASESIIYTHAFATSPVCSPSRAALINGIMASAQGAHQMRSAFPLPEAWNGFPALLREAGYYTTNNVKTDYNSGHAQTIIKNSWYENSATASWKGREANQPFFSVFNHMVSHQSRTMVWPYEEFQRVVQSQLSPEQIHDPALAPVPPYYPDTPIIRKTIARFYDSVTAMDKQVGQILTDLEEDGLLDDTIIFFYSDHGSGMPRHKRALLDSGMHVPLLVRFPEKYKHLAPLQNGERTDRLVNFADFAPTVLSLAGLEIPEHMQGVPFLGPKDATPRAYVYGHRDRVDEVIDMARSVRDHRYHYVRNYMPHLGYNQQTAWPDQGEIRHEFYKLAKGEMTDAQRHFAGPTRPLEELYDAETDPLSLNNLVSSPEHRDVLERMRAALKESLLKKRDLGFIPEVEMGKQTAGTTPYDWAHSTAYDLPAHMAAAESVGTIDFDQLSRLLNSALPGVRYWGAVGYHALADLPANQTSALTTALSDSAEIVQIEAAAALLKHGHEKQAIATLIELLSSDDETVVLYAARAIELSNTRTKAAYDAMKALHEQYGEMQTDPGLFIGFTAKGYLDRF
ncbi:MAG: sulfatase-like hydrolase/transferase [Rhodothermales bacterium]